VHQINQSGKVWISVEAHREMRFSGGGTTVLDRRVCGADELLRVAGLLLVLLARKNK
jgi:hypothetical protein